MAVLDFQICYIDILCNSVLKNWAAQIAMMHYWGKISLDYLLSYHPESCKLIDS